MYAVRALTVALSVFVLAGLAAHLVIVCAWPTIRRLGRTVAKPTLANTLFVLQVAPAALACVVVACFAVPSFLRFEPIGAEEEVSVVALLLAAVGAVFIGTAIVRAVGSWQATRRAASLWNAHSCSCVKHGAVTAYHAHASGVLAVAGVGTQKLFISHDVASALTSDELERAIAHEIVHIRRRDNLAKLAVLLCRVPGMKSIESAWLEAVEMTADERAVSSKSEALDLASALVKVSRLRTQELPDLALGFAATATAPLSARVARLLAWQEVRRDRRPATLTLIMLGTIVGASALAYHPILLQVHTFTEWLVR
jgi:beta-lactamase regulating signal transducer with metallopeptidase domain